MLLEVNVLWLGVREEVEEEDGYDDRELEDEGDEGDVVGVVVDQVPGYH